MDLFQSGWVNWDAENAGNMKYGKLDMLRENKPPPIRSIRISDFGLPDPKRDPDRHQNCTTWSLSHALPLQKISSKFVHKFASNLTDRQTDRQTDRTKNITSFFGGGNNLTHPDKYSPGNTVTVLFFKDISIVPFFHWTFALFLHSIRCLYQHSERSANGTEEDSLIPSVGPQKWTVAKRLIGSGGRLGWWEGSVEGWVY